VRVAEPGTGPTAHGPDFLYEAAAASPQALRDARSGVVPELDVTPARIPIRAQVEVTFAFVAAE
jgi:hypothetical protein